MHPLDVAAVVAGLLGHPAHGLTLWRHGGVTEGDLRPCECHRLPVQKLLIHRDVSLLALPGPLRWLNVSCPDDREAEQREAEGAVHGPPTPCAAHSGQRTRAREQRPGGRRRRVASRASRAGPSTDDPPPSADEDLAPTGAVDSARRRAVAADCGMPALAAPGGR